MHLLAENSNRNRELVPAEIDKCDVQISVDDELFQLAVSWQEVRIDLLMHQFNLQSF